MNARQIQTIKPAIELSHNYVNLSGEGDTFVDTSLTGFLRGSTIKFARRPFAGSIRVNFTLTLSYRTSNGITKRDGFITDESFPDMPEGNAFEGHIWLCPDKCREILNVGERTKKFSLWYKRVD